MWRQAASQRTASWWSIASGPVERRHQDSSLHIDRSQTSHGRIAMHRSHRTRPFHGVGRDGSGPRRIGLLCCSLMMLVLMGGGLFQRGALAGSFQPVTFRIVSAKSHVWFDADAPLHSFRGETREVVGTFTLRQISPLQIADARVLIDAASLKTGNSSRDADMHQDFLEVARFPTIEFIITDLLATRPSVDGMSWDVVMQARLSVHGTTRDVQVPATVSLTAERLTARGQVHLDMRDYQIRVPRLLLVPMRSEVLVGFDVVAHAAH